MKLRQLEAFRAVMLCQTVTRASEMLHISQPATTRLIADLEQSLGFALFERVKGRLHPTVEAQALYEEVQRSLVGLDRIARAADEIRALQRGTLQVAAAPAIALAFLPHAIADYLGTHVEANVSLLVHSSRTVVDMVVGQRCDVGIAILAMNHPSAHGERLISTRMVCAMPVGHRLCARDTIRPQDLAGERFVAHPRTLDSRLQIDALFAAHGVPVKLQLETQVSQSICAFVEAGAGVSLIDAITAWSYRGRGVVFKPFEPLLVTDFSVLTPSQRPPALLTRSFVEHVRRFALAALDERFIAG
ncbi:LysR substrate-binding domain-containing protein [Trinickia caryophylli]|uniref:Transcriptional regulator, LysR family n=1 Tax=Trinickia caryophylli TaxID=28094 RepID=A0A1X7DI21_TRICW|nr:LysR substrate-binding domain-containing protein [Trinickia caryophylli]PMS12310.1 LysR family transcriptional regulator [Trinickia caryophylli]TRX17018.1 LysR family transcriptional regulator [Trinickia caryophylli]WQE12242.1 LysR substrate-binding domain-containing protein [Trinickia caryophylli]SMF15746.1 transcriptional regulator, LysR family [Trinickia caryophylli]GLU31616.1 LysR family transcriptional regulator [Trinickia caryophylli]